MGKDYDKGFDDGFLMGMACGDDDLGSKKDGCYIATSVYGSYDCPEVWTLRRFRDARLRSTACGRGFVRLYYKVSPALVSRFGQNRVLRRAVKVPLDRLVRRLRAEGVSDAPYRDQRTDRRSPCG